ncbi:MAG: DUF3050 domain-containing protein [Parachlamydiaceae bacterium]|nr:DUF3050 domain-containing protein [Parachlamydiaceae bacterium]
MNKFIEKIQRNIEPYRQEVINHRLYTVINNIDHLRIFMQHHVYAVWDFMSLLKTLQNALTCTTIPWMPVGNGNIRYLINEIVSGEESDINHLGECKSHFELYLDAMEQAGANTHEITKFTSILKTKFDLLAAFKAAGTAKDVIDFTSFTFDVIQQGKPHIQAAVFTFGREDLIPDMFRALVNDLERENSGNTQAFKYYLERHIEVDGGHHSHLALQMTSDLCQDNEKLWQEAEDYSIQSLKKRAQLWEGIYMAIQNEASLNAPAFL